MLQNLPHDNLFKVIFFGGLLFIIAIVKFSAANDTDERLQIHNHQYRKIELKNELAMDSLELSMLATKITQLRKDRAQSPNDTIIARLEREEFTFNKITILKRKLNNEISQMGSDMDSLRDDIDINFIFQILMFVLATILFLIGLIQWAKKEDLKNRYENRKIYKEEKEIPCQSCGMALKYDFKSFIEAELCSTCFDGETYKEPQLNLKEMEERVRKKMEEQKIDKKIIKKHISMLSSLNRWSQALKW